MNTQKLINWIFNVVYIIVALMNLGVAFSPGASVGQRILAGIIGLAFSTISFLTIRTEYLNWKNDR